MDRFNALGRGAQIMLVAGVLLLIDLFLPWQDAGVSEALGVDVDDSVSGWRGVGIILGLLTIAMLAWLVVRLMSVDIPLPVSTAMTGAVLGVLVAAFGIIKLLTILGEAQTIWAWIGAILAVLVAVGAYLQVQEAGGVDTLRSEASTLSASRTTTAGSAPAATTPDEPPPPTPAAPPSSTPPSSAPAEPEAAPPPVEPAPPAEPDLTPERDEERRDL